MTPREILLFHLISYRIFLRSTTMFDLPGLMPSYGRVNGLVNFMTRIVQNKITAEFAKTAQGCGKIYGDTTLTKTSPQQLRPYIVHTSFR